MKESAFNLDRVVEGFQSIAAALLVLGFGWLLVRFLRMLVVRAIGRIFRGGYSGNTIDPGAGPGSIFLYYPHYRN